MTPDEHTADPCRCHSSHAAVTSFHDGHCCFWPPTQTCHPDEVAAWETRQHRPALLTAVTR